MSPPLRLIDTNILIALLTRDDEEKAEQALALMLRVENGEERAAVSPLVVFETIFTLQRAYRIPKEQVRDAVLPIIQLPGLHIPDKQLYTTAFEYYVELNVPFADAYNAAYMLANGMHEIYSWDSHFNRFDGVQRIAPGNDFP